MTSRNKNQGEGDREAAEKFNKEQQEFVNSKKGKEKIGKTVEIEDQEELKEAEDEGKSRAKAHDPSVVRDYNSKS